MGHAFDHKRAFEISWEQVDFNTLWTAHTLFDVESIALVEKEIQQIRPKIFDKIKTQVEVQKLEFNFTKPLQRSFEAYKEKFVNL
jgi:hypothetical protein